MFRLAGRLSTTTVHGLMAALVGLALAAVFVLPWLVPVGSEPIVSDSQAVGFSNRTAMLGLAAACIAVAGLAWIGRRSGAVAGTGALVLAGRVGPEGRVSRPLVFAAVAVTSGMVLVLGTAVGDRPVGDSAYYLNALLRVVAGGRPYAQIEFTYGPLLLYAPLLSWRILGQAGVEPHLVYYGWVAISHAIGLLLLVFILNRIHARAALRNTVFVCCAGFGALSFALPIAYTPLRFLLPYALFLGSLGSVLGATRHWFQPLAPGLAVVVTFALSPEMGAALLAALLSAAVPAIARGERSRTLLTGVGGLLALGAAAAGFAALARASTLGAFVGGALYLPVVPGPPALAFFGTMLTLSWAVGSLTDAASPADRSRHLGWFALSLVLIVPAFGRADFGHLFWNGMGALVLCAAAADERWGRGVGYVRSMGFVFIGAAALTAGVLLLWIGQRAEPTRSPEAAETLASYPGLCYTALLGGDLGVRLAEAGGLVPLYLNPASAVNRAQFEKAVGQLRAALTLAVPMADFDRYLDAAAASTVPADGIVSSTPPAVGDYRTNGLLLGFPLGMRGRNPVFDPAASFGAVLKRDWRVARLLAGHVLLERRN